MFFIAQQILSTSDFIILAILPLLLIGSGFFSGTETALFGLTARNRMEIDKRGGFIAYAIDSLLNDSRMLLITLMLGNMIMNVLYFVLSSMILLKLEKAEVNTVVIAFVSIIPLVVIIIFGEVLPKMVANTAPILWTQITSLPMMLIHRTIMPLRYLLSYGVITPISRLVSPTEKPPGLSPEEFEMLLEQSQQRGEINTQEEAMLREVVALNQMKVRDIMIPRVDMTAWELSDDIESLYELINEERRNKIPVYEEDPDHILGIIYAKEFLLGWSRDEIKDIRKLVRQVKFVPEIQSVDRMLSDFRQNKIHLAIAVDEYGGTAGMITIKDVAEFVLGDLDMDQAPGEDTATIAELVEPGRWRVSGKLSVHDWEQAFQLPDTSQHASTISGLIMTLLGRIPTEGDEVQIANFSIKVEKMEGRRVNWAVITHSSVQQIQSIANKEAQQ